MTDAEKWDVVITEPNDRTNASGGTFTVTLEQGSETAARQAYATALRNAQALSYTAIKLRRDGAIVESWPDR